MNANSLQCGEPGMDRSRAYDAADQTPGSFSARVSLVRDSSDLPRLETYAGVVLFIVNAVPEESLVGPRASEHELTAREMLTLLVYSYGRQTYSSTQIEKQLLWSVDPEQPQRRNVPTLRSIRRFRRNNLAILISCIAKLLESSNANGLSCAGTLLEKDYLAMAEDRVRTAMLLDMDDAF